MNSKYTTDNSCNQWTCKSIFSTRLPHVHKLLSETLENTYISNYLIILLGLHGSMAINSQDLQKRSSLSCRRELVDFQIGSVFHPSKRSTSFSDRFQPMWCLEGCFFSLWWTSCCYLEVAASFVIAATGYILVTEVENREFWAVLSLRLWRREHQFLTDWPGYRLWSPPQFGHYLELFLSETFWYNSPSVEGVFILRRDIDSGEGEWMVTCLSRNGSSFKTKQTK